MPNGRTPFSRQERILAVHSGALGDVVLFGHLLRGLGGTVTLAAGGAKARLLAGAGVVAGAVDFDALPMHEAFSETQLDACELPALLGRHDRLVSCFAAGDRKAELRLAAMCGARRTDFLPIRPPKAFRGHLLDLWANLMGLGEPAQDPPTWRVADSWRKAAANTLVQAGVREGEPYAVLHPGAGGETKCWPLDRFELLAGRLGRSVFVVGPVEADRWPAGRIERLRAAFAVQVCPELPALAALLAGADAVVCNDSGVGHLAAAVGAPTVALFGPTRPEHFAPRGRAVRVVAADRMEDISVDDVEAAVRGLLDGAGRVESAP